MSSRSTPPNGKTPVVGSPDQVAAPPPRRRLNPFTVVRRTREAWGRIAPFLGVSRWRMMAMAVGAVGAGLVEAALLTLIAAIASALSTGKDRFNADLGLVAIDASLATLFIIGFALALVRTGLQALMAYLPAAMAADATASLRGWLFDAFIDTSWPVQASERDGHFQALMGGHVATASRGILIISQALSSFFMFAMLLLGAFALSLPTALLLLGLSSVLFVVMRPLAKRTRFYSVQVSHETMDYTKAVQEVVRLAEETQVFGASGSFRDMVQGRINAVRLPLRRSRFYSALVPVLYQSVALIVLLIALLVVSGVATASLASLTAVVLLLVRSMTYGQQLQNALTNMYEVTPFMDRLREGIDAYQAAPRSDGDRPMPVVQTLGMTDVHFAYEPNEPVLDGFEFDVRSG